MKRIIGYGILLMGYTALFMAMVVALATVR